jgi:PadR family transcriptional regulator, regulatory protein PadR
VAPRKQDGSLSKWEMHILAALAYHSPLHGYGIKQEIQRLSDGRYSPSAATLYENLAKLVANDLVEPAGEEVIGGAKIRKMYRITALGARVLRDELQALDRIRVTLSPKLGWSH